MVLAPLSPGAMEEDEDDDGAAGDRWVAQPKQNLFLHTYKDVDEIFFGGAAGGGKTDTLLIYQAIRRLTYPGSTGLIIRRSLADMDKVGATVPRFMELFGRRVKWDKDSYTATWDNGSITQFGYCATDQHKTNYQGAQADDISFDELTQFPEDHFTYIAARARVRKKRLRRMGMTGQIRSGGNPGGIGHAWVQQRYVDHGDCQVRLMPSPDPSLPPVSCVFIASKVDDNQELLQADPGYKARLAQISDETERRAMLDGDWNVFKGQVFKEWRDCIHVKDAIVPPLHWPRYIGFDWGWASPWVALWVAEDPDTHQLYVYRELSGREQSDREIAQTIVLASKSERIFGLYADPSIWNKNSSGNSAADIMRRFPGWNIPLIPADNDRLNGLRTLHDLLAFEEVQGGVLAHSPRLVVGRNCLDTIRTVPKLVHDDVRVEDVRRRAEDHWYDALRYVCMGVGLTLIDYDYSPNTQFYRSA